MRSDDDSVAVLQHRPLQRVLPDGRRVAAARQVVEHEASIAQSDAGVTTPDLAASVVGAEGDDLLAQVDAAAAVRPLHDDEADGRRECSNESM